MKNNDILHNHILNLIKELKSLNDIINSSELKNYQNTKDINYDEFVFYAKKYKSELFIFPKIQISIKNKLKKSFSELYETTVSINNTLSNPIDDDIFSMIVRDLKDVQIANTYNRKEFTLLHGQSDTWQKQKRNRITNPLPSLSLFTNNIIYDADEVKEWMKEFHQKKLT